jgi:hypothetical protein
MKQRPDLTTIRAKKEAELDDHPIVACNQSLYYRIAPQSLPRRKRAAPIAPSFESWELQVNL